MILELEIAGVRIALRESEDRPLEYWPAQSYEMFSVDESAGPDLAFDVRVVASLPALELGALVYDGGPEQWRLYERDGGFALEAPKPGTDRPWHRALLSRDFSRGEIFTAQGVSWSPSEVITPIVEACLLSHLARRGGLLLHAAGVDFRGDGLVFTGPSGAGKSTLSGLFTERGALILNDERIVVRDVAAAPVVHGTPWCGTNPEMRKASAPLRGIYFIKHGRENRVRELPLAEASALCVRQAFLPYWDAPGLEATLASAEALCRELGGREYAFLNEPSAVEALVGEARLGALQ